MTNTETRVRTCPHCHQEFPNINPKVFSNHVRWCPENPDKDRLSGSAYRAKKATIKNREVESKFGKVKEFTVTCAKCGKQFTVRERENKFPSKEKYYCSRACANSREKPQELRERLSEKARHWMSEYGVEVYQPELRHCQCCNKEFMVKVKARRNQRFCCSKCAGAYRARRIWKDRLKNCHTDIERMKISYQQYHAACAFTFAIQQFPEEFDFDLVRKHGWYEAKNRGDNPTGVTRDHMYSIRDGFVNHIDPKIISHPANCQLMLQRENSKKNSKSSLTLDQLLERISRWEQKYPPL